MTFALPAISKHPPTTPPTPSGKFSRTTSSCVARDARKTELGDTMKVMAPAVRLMDRFEALLDWPINMVFRHFEKRILELCASCMMIGEGVLLFLSPDSIAASEFRYMLQVLSSTACCIIFLTLGLLRIVALILNGNWHPHGAYVRAGGAALAAVMWGQMTGALFTLKGVTAGPPSPSIPVYLILAVFELISMYRALAGAKQKHGIGTR